MNLKIPISFLLVASLSLNTTTSQAIAAERNLPDIGSSAEAIASPEQQRQYGAYMLHELRAQNQVLDDPLLTDYINTLGFRLVANSDKPTQPFYFFWVRSNEINAFAVPGGFVGINAGLFTTTESESELAAVLAHEIAHITQSHMVRAFEDARKSSIPIALAMLGALIASSGRNDDAAQAAVMTGTALMQQRQINFTRQDETEADRVGIQTLARSNFDVDAMAGFFGRMQRALRPTYDESEGIELLRTHPVTISRLSDSKNRAAIIKQEKKEALPPPIAVSPMVPGLPTTKKDQLQQLMATVATASNSNSSPEKSAAYYQLMRERVRVLSAERPNLLLAYYVNNSKEHTDFDTAANRYGQALALIATGTPDKSLDILQKLVSQQPNNLVFLLAQAQAQHLSGKHEEALRQYSQLERNYPRNTAVSLAYATALLEHTDTKKARQAVELLRPQIADNIDDPYLRTTFARACELSGDKIRAGQEYAEAALLNGRFEDAIQQLQALAKRTDLDYYQRARIDARIVELTPVVLELRRRHIKAGDQGQLSNTALSWGRNNKTLE